MCRVLVCVLWPRICEESECRDIPLVLLILIVTSNVIVNILHDIILYLSIKA